MASDVVIQRRDGAAAFEPGTFAELVRFAEYICGSALVPTHLRDKPKDIVLIALRAKELGIPMVAAMSMIYLVEGRVSLSAELWVAIVKRHPDCEWFRLVATTDEHATYESQRRGAPAPVRMTYTIAQAARAGLAGRGTWQKHPAALLRARAATGLARAEWPDAALGLLEHDEAEEITGRPVPIDASREDVTSIDEAPVEDLETAHGTLRAHMLDRAPLAYDVAAQLWVDYKTLLAAEGGADLATRAWGELVAACPDVATGRSKHATLKRAVAALAPPPPPPPPPPDGTTDAPRRDAAPDARDPDPDPERDAITREPAADAAAQARAAWEAHLCDGAHAAPEAIIGSCAKHGGDPASPYAALDADTLDRVAMARVRAITASWPVPWTDVQFTNKLRETRLARGARRGALARVAPAALKRAVGQ